MGNIIHFIKRNWLKNSEMEVNKEKFLLVRHAQSEFNLERILAEDRNAPIYNINLIDCRITKKGESQIEAAKKKSDAYPVSLVLVSPLRRALQTAQLLFEDHPNKPTFVVTPYLRERVSASCDVSDFIEEPLPGFEKFDWSPMMALREVYKGTYWLSEELGDVPGIDEIKKLEDPEMQKLEIVKKIEDNVKKNKKEYGNKKEKFETVKTYKKNVAKFIKFLAQLKEKRFFARNKDEVIAIVAHGGTLKELCLIGGVENYNFENCEMKEFLF